MSKLVFPRNAAETAVIEGIAEGPNEGPVLMLNLNRYVPQAAYPDGTLYRDYIRVLSNLLTSVGAKILWRTNVYGQPVGEQAIDEILAVWYPTHRTFLDLRSAPGADENFKLRGQCVEAAVIHRCAADRYPMQPG